LGIDHLSSFEGRAFSFGFGAAARASAIKRLIASGRESASSCAADQSSNRASSGG
jgi:hypothetical protein